MRAHARSRVPPLSRGVRSDTRKQTSTRREIKFDSPKQTESGFAQSYPASPQLDPMQSHEQQLPRARGTKEAACQHLLRYETLTVEL